VKVDLSDRALREMQRIDASWRKRADFPALFLDELLETVELIETTGVVGTAYSIKAKHRVLGEERVPRVPRTKVR
jgi:hypothetical protein